MFTRFIFIFAALMICLFSACNDNDQVDNEEFNIPLTIHKRIARVDHIYTADTIIIRSGMGNYTISLKSFMIEGDTDTGLQDNYLSITLDNQLIIINRLQPDDVYIVAYYLLQDSKGQCKTFAIENPGMLGLHYFED